MSKALPHYNMPAQSQIPRINPLEFLQAIKSECGLRTFRMFGSGEHIVIVLPDAEEEICTFFKVGKGRRAINMDEQQADLYGHRFLCEKDKYVFLVTRAAYIYPAERRSTFVATSGNNEDDFMAHRLRLETAIVNKNEVQYNRDEYGNVVDIGVEHYGPSTRIGQIHTHPEIGCFFSSIDKTSNESTPTTPNVYLVCDPIRNDFLAMVGTKGEPAKIWFFNPAEDPVLQIDRNESSVCSERNDVKIAQVATVCRAFLKTPGVHGRFRMFCDSKGKTHIKYHARFISPGDTQDEIKHTEKNDAR